MKKIVSTLALLAVVAIFSGCDEETIMSERGFRLPDGDADSGREVFLYMQCNQCHSLVGEDLPVVAGYQPFVKLGGTVTRVKTYGDLVTSVINPSHKLAEGYPPDLVSEDGKSRMYNYNGIMTVQELTDIVMFLQPYYDVVPPSFSYRVYP